ncbi:hypothetical protein POL68_03210 [Stigmatella sp. ncwal1]|uniref:Uncharacterized protein n=1 Tax=Stigmatella ashevillensis TaxID=2995309 RepID=A0ABT5D1C6_9BACT|nr:hypothetical protein [Stigmatella ashevillena]MDC0707470.1 hypothetical protein [Stigmatella ashevillena]
MRFPVTPDGRYFVVRGRLWRCTNPTLGPRQRGVLTHALMRARAEIRRALAAGDLDAEGAARARVNRAKIGLGERGPVWWKDGAPDFNRHLVKNTPYADWYAGLEPSEPPPPGRHRGRG